MQWCIKCLLGPCACFSAFYSLVYLSHNSLNRYCYHSHIIGKEMRSEIWNELPELTYGEWRSQDLNPGAGFFLPTSKMHFHYFSKALLVVVGVLKVWSRAGVRGKLWGYVLTWKKNQEWDGAWLSREAPSLPQTLSLHSQKYQGTQMFPICCVTWTCFSPLWSLFSDHVTWAGFLEKLPCSLPTAPPPSTLSKK